MSTGDIWYPVKSFQAVEEETSVVAVVVHGFGLDKPVKRMIFAKDAAELKSCAESTFLAGEEFTSGSCEDTITIKEHFVWFASIKDKGGSYYHSVYARLLKVGEKVIDFRQF